MEAQANEPTSKHYSAASSMRIKITPDGPYIVTGGVPLEQDAITPVGKHQEYKKKKTFPESLSYALCRCGHTKTPPFCDGSHITEHFNGTETASRIPFEKHAEVFNGEGVDLLDDHRCAFARFCHREDGDVWELTEESGNPKLREEALKASSDCPAGRLVHYDKEGNSLEPKLDPAIILLEDPQKDVSGPIFVKGGIPLESADGILYELRNRYALCRCGASRNKPFCDATHMSIGFQAE